LEFDFRSFGKRRENEYFLLPFNRDIGAKNEFRVFCATEKGISAVG
jgi:hypothetical protein